MLTSEIRITIPGRPAPKGSMKCVGQRGRHQLVEDNARSTPWRETVAGWIRQKWPTGQHGDPGQPLGIDVTVSIDRPKSHYGTGRNARVLRASAPAYPVGHQTGDTDKHARLICDAVQDTDVLPDDCALVDLNVRKRFAADTTDPDVLPYPGVVIRLYPIGTS